jgi:hypothetical protein
MLKKLLLQRIIDYGLLSLLVIFPLTVKISVISLKDTGHSLISVNFSLADIVMGIILLLWFFRLLLYKGWGQVKFPPWPVWVFTGIGILSFVNASSISGWLKETLQLAEYFILFYLLLLNNLHSVSIRTVKTVLFISMSIVLFVAGIQSFILNSDPYLVRSFFENHNVLGTYLCTVIPLVYVDFVFSKNRLYKIWMGLLLLLSVLTISSGSAIFALITGLSVISFYYGRELFLRHLLGCAVLSVLYILLMPAKNKETIRDFATIYEQGSVSQNYYRRLSLLGDIPVKVIYKKQLDASKLLLVTGNEPGIHVLPEIRKGDAYKEMEGKKHIKNRYLEMQADVNLMSEFSLTGIGLGNYQDYISAFFKGFPKVNTSEPNQHNTYLVIGSSMGLLGLAALFYMLCGFVKKSFSGFKHHKRNDINKSIFFGLAGSMVTLMIEGFFSFIFNASLMVPLIVLFFLMDKQHENEP